MGSSEQVENVFPLQKYSRSFGEKTHECQLSLTLEKLNWSSGSLKLTWYYEYWAWVVWPAFELHKNGIVQNVLFLVCLLT